MPVAKPYFRICRPFANGSYAAGGISRYIEDERYSESPEQYIRAFIILLEDLKKLFEYIEPSDANLQSYSFRTHELLLRTCTEIEANFKAIFTENGYTKKGNFNIIDYQKINKSHKLSSYQIKIPFWTGKKHIRKPFSSWAKSKQLDWYQDYNAAKHDRHNSFNKATFGNVVSAMAGLMVVLSAQFYTYDFLPSDPVLGLEGKGDGMEAGIGDYFRVKFPTDWPKKHSYDFDWNRLRQDPHPFQPFDFSKV